MSNVYVVMPTMHKDHVPDVLAKWRKQGYKIGLMIDHGASHDVCDILIRCDYPNVWNAWNALARTAVCCGADLVVMIGDDIEPDMNHTASEIAAQYFERFPNGDGVLQPCGDPQGTDDSGRPAAARICGSPWVGREWIKRAYHGNGPVDVRYNSFYADESLFNVAGNLGKLCMQPGLTQFHRHWSFPGGLPRQAYHERNQKHWADDKALFEKSLAAGFPEGAFL